MSDFYATMYQDDEDDNPEAGSSTTPQTDVAPKGILSMPALTSELRKLQKVVEDQARQIRRLEHRCHELRRIAKSHEREIGNVDRRVDGKLDAY